MSIASALLASAAPAPVGMPTAAASAIDGEASLFSSRVAVMLHANLKVATIETAEPRTHSSLTSLEFLHSQAFADPTSAPTDTTAQVDFVQTASASSPFEAVKAPLVSLTDTASTDESISTEPTTATSDIPIPVLMPTPQAAVTPQTRSDKDLITQDWATKAIQPEATAAFSAETDAPVSIKTETLQVEPAPVLTGRAASVDGEGGADSAVHPKTSLTRANQVAFEAMPAFDTPATDVQQADSLKKASVGPAQQILEADSVIADPSINRQLEPAKHRPSEPSPALPIQQETPNAVGQQLAAKAMTSAVNPEPSAAPADAKAAATSPIAQLLTEAQISASQVQVAVSVPRTKSALMVSGDVTLTLAAAEPSGKAATASAGLPTKSSDADTSSAPAQLTSSRKATRHETAQQGGNAATTPSQTQPDTNGVDPAPKQIADLAAAKTAAPPLKAADVAGEVVAADMPSSVDGDVNAPAPSETQPVQHAAESSRDLGLSTLSRATVETTAQLAAQIARKLEGRSTRFDMVLTPDDLGRVDVQLEIGKDGQLSARLAFDNPAAAADLRGRADELRRQLQDAGFQVAGDALDFSQRDAAAGGGGGAFDRQQQRNAMFAGGSRLADLADTPSTPAPGVWINHSRTPDRVDLKV